jgi:valyl-tRNA synthetase
VSLLLGISPGNDSRYYEEKIESGRNFVNKLWNISRFILAKRDMVRPIAESELTPKTLADAWILARFHTLAEEVTQHLDRYEFSQAGEKLRDFTWSEFADWYLEISKTQTSSDLLLYLLEQLLVLWHPFMPFVTEEIWKQFGTGSLLMAHPWTQTEFGAALSILRSDGSYGRQAKPSLEVTFIKFQAAVVGIRNIRSLYHVEPKQKLRVVISGTSEFFDEDTLSAMKFLAGLESVEIAEGTHENAAALAIGDLKIFVLLGGVVDKEKEMTRIQKEMDELTAYLTRTKNQLGIADFVARAPASVVEEMRRKYDTAEKTYRELQEQLTAISLLHL